MRSIGPKIWIEDRPLKVPLIGNLGIRMTVIQLASGELLLISPVPLTDDLQAELEKIGPITYLIGPNSMHHLSLRQYHRAFPNAQLAAPLKLQKRKKSMSFSITLIEGQSYPWSQEIEMKIVDSNGMMSEAVFFHHPSRTLILTDLLFNLPVPHNWKATIPFYINGLYRGLTMSNLARIAFRNRRQLRQKIQEMSQWNFDQIVLSHGEIVPNSGKQKFLQAFHWLLH